MKPYELPTASPWTRKQTGLPLLNIQGNPQEAQLAIQQRMPAGWIALVWPQEYEIHEPLARRCKWKIGELRGGPRGMVHAIIAIEEEYHGERTEVVRHRDVAEV